MSFRALVPATLILATLAAAPAFAAEFNLGLSVGAGRMEAAEPEPWAPDENDVGFSLGFELLAELPAVELGGGIEYGPPRDAVYSDLEYTFAYAIVRVKVVTPLYLVGRYGREWMTFRGERTEKTGEDDGWSLGVGVQALKRLRAEALYGEGVGDVDFSATSVRLVVVF